MIDEALEHLVKGIVDNPEEVVITEKNSRGGTTLEVRVHPEDIGKVIGLMAEPPKHFAQLLVHLQEDQFALI